MSETTAHEPSDLRTWGPYPPPPPAPDERTVREIFMKLTRIDGKLEGLKAVSDRIATLESEVSALQLAEAERKGRGATVQYLLTFVVPFVSAAIGAFFSKLFS